jgi:N-acetyl-gamma-glutamylphosphate reductase
VNRPPTAFAARPDFVPDEAVRSLPTGAMPREDGRSARCAAAPGCSPVASELVVAPSATT